MFIQAADSHNQGHQGQHLIAPQQVRSKPANFGQPNIT